MLEYNVHNMNNLNNNSNNIVQLNKKLHKDNHSLIMNNLKNNNNNNMKEHQHQPDNKLIMHYQLVLFMLQCKDQHVQNIHKNKHFHHHNNNILLHNNNKFVYHNQQHIQHQLQDNKYVLINLFMFNCIFF